MRCVRRVRGSVLFGLAPVLLLACGSSGGGRSYGGSGGSKSDAGAGAGGRQAGGGTTGTTGGASGAAGAGGGSAAGGVAGNNSGGIGGAGGSGGGDAGGSPPDGGRTPGGTPIQTIQDGSIALGVLVDVKKVFVTAARQIPSGLFPFVVQEPQGQTVGSHVYPEYAGVEAVIYPGDSGLGATPSLGDCVDVSGTVGDFHGLTELLHVTWQPASGCGTFPQPFAIPTTTVSFGAVATDTDLVTAGNQAGAFAERYESVLVRFPLVQAVAVPGPGGGFQIVEQSDALGAQLAVDPFYYAAVPTAGQKFSSISGIFSEFDRYLLQPRSLGDVIQ